MKISYLLFLLLSYFLEISSSFMLQNIIKFEIAISNMIINQFLDF